MIPNSVLSASLLLFCASTFAQAPDPSKPVKPARTAYYIDTKVLDLSLLVSPPPAQDSETVKAEVAEIHRIEQNRTPAQVAAAKADEDDQTIFVFRSVLGDKFAPDDLPLTAALGAHVHNEEPVASNVLKAAFHRPRPYQFDTTLHPVCKTSEVPDSYPSGHGVSGYLLAFTVAQIVPEKRTEILARADEYAHNRLVCGVHYPSDLAASRSVAYAVFGYMMATPRFQVDLAAARTETRKKLGLN